MNESSVTVTQLNDRPTYIRPVYSTRRCKEVLAWGNLVMQSFQSKNFEHDDKFSTRPFVCIGKPCPCPQHSNQDCSNDFCVCPRHVISFLCGWYPNRCPMLSFEHYRACQASGILINTDFHVCHVTCPFVRSDQNKGFVCSVSGVYYPDAALVEHAHNFKIDRDKLSELWLDDGRFESEDELDQLPYEPAKKCEAASSGASNTVRLDANIPDESKQNLSPQRKAASAPKFLRTDWEAVNMDMTTQLDLIRRAIINEAKAVIRSVLLATDFPEDDITTLATAASTYYVEYRIAQTRQKASSPNSSPGSSSGGVSSATETNQTSRSESSNYHKASVCMQRTRKPKTSSPYNEQLAEVAERDDTQCNKKMFWYFALGFLQGCLSNNPPNSTFPQFPFVSLNDFVALREWDSVTGVLNRRVTRYTTGISTSVERGDITPWSIESSPKNLVLPQEALQWTDWR